ncbi:MAG: hypothetical protein RL196_539 [Actinomycetota bacterium]
MRALIRIITALAIFAASLIGVQPATATPTWVSGISWTNLHVKHEDGVFERYRREFDAQSVLQTQSETQHNQAWVRTDRDSVTVTYTGTAANANRLVRFNLDGDVPFTYSTPNTVVTPANLSTLPASLEVMTDGDGNAEVTMTLTGTTQADRADIVLRAGISDGTTDVGNMVLVFQPAGFYSVIKLVGTGSGPEATCNTMHPFECNDADLDEKTWTWSVFKKDWLPEYSQVFVKSYLPGSTLNMLYKVTDIWNTPIASKQVTLNLDAGCRVCKWSKTFVGTKSTDSRGYVKFSLKNLNTVTQVKNNSFTNTDTKIKESGVVAFALLPTTNELDESFDEFWPQLVTDIDILGAATQLKALSRGGLTADGSGNVLVGSEVNPAHVIDEADNQLSDTDVINLNISYVKNSLAKPLYAPDVKVTATNGGVSGLVLPATPVETYASASSQKSTLVFGYTYPQRIAVTCTRPGTTVFKIATGKNYKEYEMDCVLPEHAASKIVAVSSAQIGLPTVASNVAFKVTDRFGNGISGVTVNVVTAGNGTITGATSYVSDAAGLVSVATSATAAGDQTLTATAVDGAATFTADTVSSTVRWGVTTVATLGAKGSVKVTIQNAKGKTASVFDGKSKVATIKLTKLAQTNTVKIKKAGSHALTIKIGASTYKSAVKVS